MGKVLRFFLRYVTDNSNNQCCVLNTNIDNSYLQAAGIIRTIEVTLMVFVVCAQSDCPDEYVLTEYTTQNNNNKKNPPSYN